jgi:hypothetical protein
MFPVRYELSFYIFRRNSVFKVLRAHCIKVICDLRNDAISR